MRLHRRKEEATMLNRILTLALMLSVVVCCIFVFTEDPPELEQTWPAADLDVP